MFQKRLDGSVDFYLNWNDYQNGFGNLSGEFWLGLEKIHRLTSDNNSMLRVDLEDFEGNATYAEYNTFGVTSENDKYKMILGSYSGNLLFLLFTSCVLLFVKNKLKTTINGTGYSIKIVVLHVKWFRKYQTFTHTLRNKQAI